MTRKQRHPSCWSVVRTSGNPRLFNRMTGSRRAIVAPVAGTTRDALSRPVSWQGATFELFDTGGLVRRQRGPAARARRAAGAARDRRRRSPGLRGGWPRGAGVRRRDDRARAARDRACPSSSRSTRPTTSGRGAGVTEFYQLGFEPVVEISAEHGPASATCSTRSSARLTGRREPAGPRSRLTPEAESTEPNRGPSRVRVRASRQSPTRPPSPSSAGQCRQVVAGQPAAEGRARDGQRHAGHDARRHRRAC